MTSIVLRYDLRLPEWAPHSRAELYDTALRQATWADELGLDAVMISEHHGSADGYMPAPLTFAAAVATRTTQIPITIAALIVPLHHPLRLVEQLLVLDHLSNGRVAPIIGAGYVPSEFAAAGRDLVDRADAVEEFVEVMRSAWSGQPFEFRGRTVRLTPPGINPQPMVLMGGSSPAAARRAARLGDWFVPEDPEIWPHYRQAVQDLGSPDPGPGPDDGPRFIHIAENPDETWDRIGPYLLHENNAYAALGAEAGRDNGYAHAEDVGELRARELYQVLTPDECIDRARAAGDDGALPLHPLCGGMDPAASWESLHLLEKRVMPALDR